MKKENLEKKNENEIERKESIMNKPVINLIIGILIGAVITATIFLLVKPKNIKTRPNFPQIRTSSERVRPRSNNSFGRRDNRSGQESSDSKVENNPQSGDNQNAKQG